MSPDPNETGIVIACPTCFRVIWAGSTCTHGRVPPPSDDAPKEPGDPHLDRLDPPRQSKPHERKRG